jgi:DME family drug/metabolite transporter
MRASITRGSLLILAGAVLFGTTGTAQFFAPAGISPSSTGAIRLAVGGPLLGLLALTIKQRPRPKKETAKPLTVPLAFSIGGVTLYQLCFFKAVMLTGVAAGTLVAIGTAPIVAGAIGYIVLKETAGLKWCTATALTLTGCCLLVLPGGNLTIDSTGVLLALASGSGYAVYLTASKRLLATRPALPMTAIALTAGAVLLSPVLFHTDWGLWLTPQGAGVALWLGIMATGVAYLLVAMGLATTPLASGALMTLAEPMVACILGILVVGEPLTPASGAGMLLILGGLVVVSLQPGATRIGPSGG